MITCYFTGSRIADRIIKARPSFLEASSLRISLISKLTIGTSLILLVFMVFFAYINIETLKTMLLEAGDLRCRQIKRNHHKIDPL